MNRKQSSLFCWFSKFFAAHTSKHIPLQLHYCLQADYNNCFSLRNSIVSSDPHCSALLLLLYTTVSSLYRRNWWPHLCRCLPPGPPQLYCWRHKFHCVFSPPLLVLPYILYAEEDTNYYFQDWHCIDPHQCFLSSCLGFTITSPSSSTSISSPVTVVLTSLLL